MDLADPLVHPRLRRGGSAVNVSSSSRLRSSTTFSELLVHDSRSYSFILVPYIFSIPNVVPVLLPEPFTVSLRVTCYFLVRFFCAGGYVWSSRALYPTCHMSSSRSCCSCKFILPSSFHLRSVAYLRLFITDRSILLQYAVSSMLLSGVYLVQ